MRPSRVPSPRCRSAPVSRDTMGCLASASLTPPSPVAPSRWSLPEQALDIAHVQAGAIADRVGIGAFLSLGYPQRISSPPCRVAVTPTISPRVWRSPFPSRRRARMARAIETAIEGERTHGIESSRHPHLHAVARAVAGSAVLALLRRQRAVPHRRHDAVLCHVGRLSRVVVGLCDARALARAIGSAARRCADLSRGFWRSGKALLR